MPLSTSQKPYEGEVNEDNFSMMLLAKYVRKNMAPVKGKIEQDVGGYVVKAKVRLHIIGDILLLLGLTVPFLFIIIDFVRPILKGTATSINYSVEFTVLLGLVGLYLVFYFMQMPPFWRMQNRVKKDLCMLLKTEDVEDLGIRGERRKEYE